MMSVSIFQRYKILFLAGILQIALQFTGGALDSFGQPPVTPVSNPNAPAPYEGELIQDPNHILDPKVKINESNTTNNFIDQMERKIESGNSGVLDMQQDLILGQARAQQMVNILKDSELQQALVKVTARGKDVLADNPGIKGPGIVIAGAVSLWVGRTAQLIKGDVIKVDTRIEVRNRLGEFSMRSPLLDGKLQFSMNDGNSVSINRSISSIDSKAEFKYNLRYQTMTGEIHHTIIPHLDLNFGSAQIPLQNQTDGHAGLLYQFNF
jgi:hypothetical protein